METQEKTTERKSVYFFCDYDLTEEDVREILRGSNETEKIWVMSRILQSARWDDIWKFLTLQNVQAYFDKIQWRTPYLGICGSTRWRFGVVPSQTILTLAMAKQKDGGLTEFYLAGMMRQARELHRLPRMLKPIDLQTLQEFYLNLAQELMRGAKPA